MNAALAKTKTSKTKAAKNKPAKTGDAKTQIAQSKTTTGKTTASKTTASKTASSKTTSPKSSQSKTAVAKTQPTTADVNAFLAGVADAQRRQDCQTLLALMQAATKAEPILWGSSIVGFGKYRYRYASGREGDWPIIGFSPRKQDLTLYVLCDLASESALLQRLGPHKHGKSCLYLKRLADVDLAVLKQLIAMTVAHMQPRRIT